MRIASAFLLVVMVAVGSLSVPSAFASTPLSASMLRTVPTALSAVATGQVQAVDWGGQRIAFDSTGNSGFATSVAVDGDTAVVGMPYGEKVYVYAFQDGIWTKTQELVSSDGQTGLRFGFSVAIDGDTIVVGAPFARNAVAYVYTRASDGYWTGTSVIPAGDIGAVLFGNSVAVDGDWMLIGAPNADTNRGVAYLFQRDGDQWVEKDTLIANDGESGDQFGFAVSLSGSRAVAGAYTAPGENTQGGAPLDRAGAAYVFNYDGSDWQQEAKLVADDAAAYQQFANAVSIDGQRVAVGAVRSTIGTQNFQGAVYVYEVVSGAWAQTAKVVADDGGTQQNFGNSVALRDDVLMVGAPRAWFDDLRSVGAAYIYALDNGDWLLDTKLNPVDAADNVIQDFGSSVAIGDARLAVGAPNAPNEESGTGAVYMYVPRDEIAYLVTPAVVEGLGSISPDSAQVVPYGSGIDFTLTPALGYHVASVDGSCEGTLDGLTYAIDAVVDNCTVEVTFAIDAPTTASVISGAPQSTLVNHAFPEPIVVGITNDAGLGVPGVEVSFTVPAAGASADIAASGITDDDGLVSLPLIANSVAGTYAVVAGADGIDEPAQFQMTNTADVAYSLKPIQGDGQSAPVGATFPVPLTVQLLDGWNNPIVGASVTFSAPDSGASADLSASEVQTDAAGIAAVTVSANRVAGSYVVDATVSGMQPVQFTLTNGPADISLGVAIDNGRDRVFYGSTQNYLVTITNSGSQPATGVDVVMDLPPQLDESSAHWICLYTATGACTASGDGALADGDVTIPASGSAGYLLSAPVRADAEGDDVTVGVMANSDMAPAIAEAADNDILAVFYDGFERADGLILQREEHLVPAGSLDVGQGLDLTLDEPDPDAPWIETAFIANEGLRIEQLNTVPLRVRLVVTSEGAAERASGWLPVSPDHSLRLEMTKGEAELQLRMSTDFGVEEVPLMQSVGPWQVEAVTTGERHD